MWRSNQRFGNEYRGDRCAGIQMPNQHNMSHEHEILFAQMAGCLALNGPQSNGSHFQCMHYEERRRLVKLPPHQFYVLHLSANLKQMEKTFRLRSRNLTRQITQSKQVGRSFLPAEVQPRSINLVRPQQPGVFPHPSISRAPFLDWKWTRPGVRRGRLKWFGICERLPLYDID